MFKKLLTLAAVAALGMSANAAMVEDWSIDYTTTTWNYYVMGYIPSQEDGWLTVKQTYGSWERVDGEAVFTPNDDKNEDGQPDASWYQLFVADGIPTAIGNDYIVTIYGKANVEASANMNMQWGWGDGQSISKNVPFTTEWSEIEVTYPEVGGASCALVLQPGTQETVFEIKWIKVSHKDESKPIEWIDLLEGGDAENGPADCAIGKVYGQGDAGIGPCAVEAVDAEHGNAFVLRATAMAEFAWDNQFWIVSPQKWHTDDTYLLSFDYKADVPAKASTQLHNDPGAYMHWSAIGDINFTTDWQTFSKQVSIPKEGDGGHSIAFNLNEYADANVYYFDNITLKAMKLDEGWFVAYDVKDLDGALEMEWISYGFEDVPVLDEEGEPVLNEDGEEVTETVETGIYQVYCENKTETIMISNKRGNDQAFKSAGIKIAGTVEITEGDWIGYTKGYGKIQLPEMADWTVKIDPITSEICFEIGDTRETSSIAAIEDENAPAVYYNLQGIQVQHPVHGQIYIVKKGNKVSKVIR